MLGGGGSKLKKKSHEQNSSYKNPTLLSKGRIPPCACLTASLASPHPCPPSRNPHNSSTRRAPFRPVVWKKDRGSEQPPPAQGHPVGGRRGLAAPTALRPAAAQGVPWGGPRAGAPQVPLALELLHDLQEAIVSGRIAAEADLHLVQVGEGVFHLRGGGGSRWATVGAEGAGAGGPWREGCRPGSEGRRQGVAGPGPSGAEADAGPGSGGALAGGANLRGLDGRVPQGGLGHHSRAPEVSRGPQSPSDPSGRRSAPGPQGRRRRRRQRAPCWNSEPRPAPPPARGWAAHALAPPRRAWPGGGWDGKAPGGTSCRILPIKLKGC